MTQVTDLSAEEKRAAGPLQRGQPSSSAFEQLRELLLGREKTTLNRLEERLENPALRAEDVGRVLPQAFSRCTGQDDRLAGAMAPAVEAALKTSIKRDPSVVTNAIFPVIGPAIRKAISDAFSRLAQTFSAALENSFSMRGLGWRLEAWRTGRPFAEVVLYHTLVFRVEQVFLVHRPTGLLLIHAAAPEVKTTNEDVISGMLSAVQDFMKDSFHAGPGEHLQTVRVGDLNLWVETGPHAILAAVIRGQAPAEFQQTLEQALETIHREESAALASFAGDAAPFESLRPRLEECLQSISTQPQRRGFSPQAAAVLAVVLLVLLVWGVLGWRQRQKRENFLNKLRAEPGFVITDAASAGGKLTVSGLRDPLAADPAQMAGQSGLRPDQVEFRLKPFLALNPEFTLQRARVRLAPPAGVEIALREGVLMFTGTAPEAWWREAQAKALLVPGIEGVNADTLQVAGPMIDPTPAERLARILKTCEQTAIFFERGKATTHDAEPVLAAIAASVRELRELAQTTGARAALIIAGHSDPSGAEELNLKLRRQRAEWVRQKLTATGLPEDFMRIDIAGTPAPADADFTTGEISNPRRVTFSVYWQH